MSAPVFGAELWVDRNSLGGPCDDTRARAVVTESTPWCTLEAAGATVEPGDTVIVREGIYDEQNMCTGCTGLAVLETSVAGTAAHPIRFVAMPGETVVLSGRAGTPRGIQFSDWGTGEIPRHIEVDGFEVRDFSQVGVRIVRTSDISIRHLDITNCELSPIGAAQSEGIIIEGCSIHHNAMEGWTSGISLHQCEGDNVLRANRIWANTDEHPAESEGHGIILDYCASSASVLIENNIIWDNEGWCVVLLHSDGATVRNNTCWENALGRPNGTGELAVKGNDALVHNNVLVSRGTGPSMQIVDMGDLGSVLADNNLMWSPSTHLVVQWDGHTDTVADYRVTNPHGWGANSVQFDPELIDPTHGSFQPAASSPILDVGSNTYSAPLDARGLVRPRDGDGDGTHVADLGAYEHEPSFFWDDFETGDLVNWDAVCQ
jgi:parallel beta-helix repeat protein